MELTTRDILFTAAISELVLPPVIPLSDFVIFERLSSIADNVSIKSGICL